MAPASGKATYKSYEAQARLVRAIVAAHPDVKWNYKGKLIFISLASRHSLLSGLFCVFLFFLFFDCCFAHVPSHHDASSCSQWQDGILTCYSLSCQKLSPAMDQT